MTLLEHQRAEQVVLLSKLKLKPKTCEEIRVFDPDSETGMYWVDPDGNGLGDPPIYVHCNMATGSTSVAHDNEHPADVCIVSNIANSTDYIRIKFIKYI